MTAVALERREGVWGFCGDRKGRETGSFKEGHEREQILSLETWKNSLKHVFVIQSHQLVWATFALVLTAKDQATIPCWLWFWVMVFFWNDSWELQTMCFFQTFPLKHNHQLLEGVLLHVLRQCSFMYSGSTFTPSIYLLSHLICREAWAAYRYHSHH